MGTQSDHRRKADHNPQFLASIDRTRFPDWFVTVCVYKALHLVEMFFATLNRHSNSHRERDDTLKRRYPDLWKQYRPLAVISRRARYNARHVSGETVVEIQGRLAKVEQRIDALMQ